MPAWRRTAGAGTAGVLSVRPSGVVEPISERDAGAKPRSDPVLAKRVHEHFDQLTRSVLHVPYDPTLSAAARSASTSSLPGTREARLQVAASSPRGYRTSTEVDTSASSF
jgi:hypothetical protein